MAESEEKKGDGDKEWDDWRTKMALAIEGALLQSLRRQPTRRLDIYEEFVQLYGLSKTLLFAPAAERVACDHDYWAELYYP